MTISSDFSKKFVPEIAALASLGLITTEVGHGMYGREWRPTVYGLAWLEGER